jgi:hypothetical protein
MDLQEVGCGGVDSIDLAQGRKKRWAFVNEVMNLRVSSNAGNFLTNCGPAGFSGTILLHGVSKLVS